MARTKFYTGNDDQKIEDPLIRPLFEDMVEIEKILESEDSQFARRTYVRSAFAFIEGQIWFWRQEVANSMLQLFSTGSKLNIPAYCALLDQKVSLDKTGKHRIESIRNVFLSDMAFVIRSGLELVGCDPAPRFEDNGWNCMRKSLKLRHKLTHPKDANELSVTDSDLNNLGEALRWFLNQFAAYARELTPVMERARQDIASHGVPTINLNK